MLLPSFRDNCRVPLLSSFVPILTDYEIESSLGTKNLLLRYPAFFRWYRHFSNILQIKNLNFLHFFSFINQTFDLPQFLWERFTFGAAWARNRNEKNEKKCNAFAGWIRDSRATFAKLFFFFISSLRATTQLIICCKRTRKTHLAIRGFGESKPSLKVSARGSSSKRARETREEGQRDGWIKERRITYREIEHEKRESIKTSRILSRVMIAAV